MNNQLLLRCVYRNTQTIINNKSLVYAFYRNQCFKTTKLLVCESKELKEYKSIISAINIIEKYPNKFLPSYYDRFVFEKDGKQLFSMINIDSNQEGKSTFIELN